MKKIIIVGIASLAIVGVIGGVSLKASAQNSSAPKNGNGTQLRNSTGNGAGRQNSLERRAGVLDMTVEQLKEALKTKSVSQIAAEKGMDEATFRAKMAESAKTRWEERGLSSEEITKRIADREARHKANSANRTWGSGDCSGQGGYGRNR